MVFAATRTRLDDAHGTGESHRAADEPSILRTDGEEQTYLHNFISVCSVEQTQVTDGGVLSIHICAKCDDNNKSIPGRL